MTRVTFPTEIKPEKVRELAIEYSSLEAQQVSARQALKEAERALEGAQEADSRSLAAAIRAGEKEPDAKQTQKAEEAIVQAKRRMEAVAVALASCESELGAAVDGARATWLADLDGELQETLQQFAAAVETLSVANDRLTAVKATVAWVSQFKLGSAVRFHAPKGAGIVTSWRLPNGSFASMSEVVTALREMARPKNEASRVVVGQFADSDGIDPDRARLKPAGSGGRTWLNSGR